MFPVTTLEEALTALERAFDCQAHVQDAVDVLYHDIPVITDAGTLYRNGDEIGTFAVSRAKCDGRDQVVDIRFGAVGEICGNPRSWQLLEDWVTSLDDYFAPAH
jgi:hypothetical protein